MTKLLLLLLLATTLHANEYLITIPPNEAYNKGIFKSIDIYVISNKPTFVKLEYNKDSTTIIKETINGFVKFSSTDNEIQRWWELREFGKPNYQTIRISSYDSIVVYVRSSKSRSSEGYLAIPISEWGREYIHCGYYEYSEFTAQYWPRGTGCIILANEDNTLIEIVLKGTNATKTTDGFIVGDTLNIRLNKNQQYGISTTMDNPHMTADFTGTLITSNKPVGVVSFNMRTKIPSLLNSDGRDPLYEMLPPIDKWNYQYIALEFDRLGGGDYFRLIASEDSTEWQCKYYDYKTGSLIDSLGGILNKSEWFEYKELDTINKSIRGLSFWESDKPTMLMQYSYSGGWEGVDIYDPFMIVIPAKTQYKNYIKFFVPDMQNNYINIICTENPLDLYLDSIMVNNIDINFQYNKINNINYTHLAISPGIHELYGTEFYAIGYGYEILDSYGWVLNPLFLNTKSEPSISVNSYDFGRQRINKTYYPYEPTLIIKNEGTDNLIIDSIAIIGDDLVFGLQDLDAMIIKQGEYHYYPIIFRPKDTIDYSVIINFYTNAKDTFSILSGTGIAPLIDIQDVNYDTLVTNNYKPNTRTWAIGNDGSDDVLVYGVQISGDVFTYIKQFPITIPPDSLYKLQGKFLAQDIGYYSERIRTISDAMEEDTAKWYGYAVEKNIRYSVSCGYSCIHNGDTIYVELENYGKVNIEIKNIEIINNKTIFFLENNNLIGYILKSQETITIKVIFIPEEITFITSELIITTDFKDIYITLEGEGYMNKLRFDLMVGDQMNVDVGREFTLPINYLTFGESMDIPVLNCIMEYPNNIITPIKDSIKISDGLINDIRIEDVMVEPGQVSFKLYPLGNGVFNNDYGELLTITFMTYLPSTVSKFIDIKLSITSLDSCYTTKSKGGALYLNNVCAENIRRVNIYNYATKLINVNQNGQVNYSLGMNGSLSLEIYNIEGELMLRVLKKNQMAGVDYWNIGTSLINGTYFCRMLFGDYSNTLKFQISK